MKSFEIASVVISSISIVVTIASVGVAYFFNRRRDIKRDSDIEAIAIAKEVMQRSGVFEDKFQIEFAEGLNPSPKVKAQLVRIRKELDKKK